MNMSLRKKWLMFSGITAAGFFTDAFTKHFAASNLSVGIPVPVIGHYLEWMLVYNRGGLFGLDPRSVLPGFPLNAFFYVFSIIAVIVLCVYYHNIKSGSLRIYLGVSFIMPGALGNLYDRILHPSRGVVDFIKMGISENHYWPIYNLADVFITAGVSLILLDLALEEIKRGSRRASGGAAGA